MISGSLTGTVHCQLFIKKVRWYNSKARRSFGSENSTKVDILKAACWLKVINVLSILASALDLSLENKLATHY